MTRRFTAAAFRLALAVPLSLPLALANAAEPVALSPAETPAAGAVVLQPHRAIYDLSLARSESSSDVAGVNGRLVYQISGSACDGYTVESRFVTDVDDQEGKQRTTDVRSKTFESPGEQRFDFDDETYTNGSLDQTVKGTAAQTGNGITIKLTEPEKKELHKAGDILFPSAQVIAMIEAAQAGKKIMQANVYDASESGDIVYQTTAAIGKPQPGVGPAKNDKPDALKALDGKPGLVGWPVALSYFDPAEAGQSGEQLPSYEMHFLLYNNGITRNLVLDYGNFSLSAQLVGLELKPVTPCGKGASSPTPASGAPAATGGQQQSAPAQ